MKLCRNADPEPYESRWKGSRSNFECTQLKQVGVRPTQVAQIRLKHAKFILIWRGRNSKVEREPQARLFPRLYRNGPSLAEFNGFGILVAFNGRTADDVAKDPGIPIRTWLLLHHWVERTNAILGFGWPAWQCEVRYVRFVEFCNHLVRGNKALSSVSWNETLSLITFILTSPFKKVTFCCVFDELA